MASLSRAGGLLAVASLVLVQLVCLWCAARIVKFQAAPHIANVKTRISSSPRLVCMLGYGYGVLIRPLASPSLMRREGVGGGRRQTTETRGGEESGARSAGQREKRPSAECLPCLYCVCVDDVTAEQSAFIVQYLLDHDNPLGYTRTLGGAVWGSTGRVGGAHVRPGLGLGDGERVCLYSRG